MSIEEYLKIKLRSSVSIREQLSEALPIMARIDDPARLVRYKKVSASVIEIVTSSGRIRLGQRDSVALAKAILSDFST